MPGTMSKTSVARILRQSAREGNGRTPNERYQLRTLAERIGAMHPHLFSAWINDLLTVVDEEQTGPNEVRLVLALQQ